MNITCTHNASTSFPTVKHKLKSNTIKVGGAVTSFYFLSQGVSLGTSSMIGSISSVAYVHLLTNYVETIEKESFQKQMVVPIAMTVAESIWNHSQTPFDLDFLTTLVGFFSYKLALFGIIFDIIKHDFAPVEDETKKIYNNLD